MQSGSYLSKMGFVKSDVDALDVDIRNWHRKHNLNTVLNSFELHFRQVRFLVYQVLAIHKLTIFI